jgi:hypothetical protein
VNDEKQSEQAQIVPEQVSKALDRVEKAGQVAAKAEGGWMGKRQALVESVEKAKGAGATREQVEERLKTTGLSETSVKDVLLKGGFRARKERSDKGKPKAKVVSQVLEGVEQPEGEKPQADGDPIASTDPAALAGLILAKRGLVGARAVLAALMDAINTAAKDGGKAKAPRKVAQG